jgi:hypothetical protein
MCVSETWPRVWKLRQQHLETVTSFVCASRNFFLEGAALRFGQNSVLVASFVVSSMNVHSYFLFLCATMDIVVGEK